VLLTVVALVQINLALTKDLSPWKGGGFGMFSTMDGPGNRQVDVFLSIRDKQYLLKFPDDDRIELVHQLARTYPGESTGKYLLNELQNFGWYCSNDFQPLGSERYKCLTGKNLTKRLKSAPPKTHIEYENFQRVYPESFSLTVHKLTYIRGSNVVEKEKLYSTKTRVAE